MYLLLLRTCFFPTVQTDAVFEVPLPTDKQRSHASSPPLPPCSPCSPPLKSSKTRRTAPRRQPAPSPSPPTPLQQTPPPPQQRPLPPPAGGCSGIKTLLRSFRMLLRDIVTRLLTNRKWEAFWQPVGAGGGSQYYDKVATPMDLCTLLCQGGWATVRQPTQFLADLSLIAEAERQYWGDAAAAPRYISRACALEDAARGALDATLAPESVRERLEKMEAAGGPAAAPPGLAAPVPVPAAPAGEEGEEDGGAGRRATRHQGGGRG